MKIINRKARFNYQILDKIEAGIALTGAEVKSVRAKRVNLTQSYARVMGGEVYLINANFSGQNVTEPTRSRKLLLRKRQIGVLLTKIKAKKLTLVPVAVYTKGRLVKIELALAKSKRKFEKRQVLKERDIKRNLERDLKN